jgi:hypothetical protein
VNELRAGRYVVVDQDDGNLVVYLADTMQPAWDKFSFEAGAPPHDMVDPRSEPPGSAVPSPSDVIHLPSGGGGRRPIRVTDERDGELAPRMYSYWSSAYVMASQACVLVPHTDGHPRFFMVDLQSGGVDRLGARLYYRGTGEGWYWSPDGWVYLCDGPHLRRVNPFTGEDVLVADISETHPGCDLFQSHSSDDGRTHSATVRRIVSDGPYPNVGTLLVHDGAQVFYPTRGALDESAITPDGAFLIIKDSEDNDIKPLNGGQPWTIRNAEGAVGHSDCGPGFMVGEDDTGDTWQMVRWDLSSRTKRVIHRGEADWGSGMGYVSIRGGRCLHSDATHLNLVALDGAGVQQLRAHGGGTDYDDRVKANLSPCGRVATYMVRGVVYVLELP